MSLWGFPIHFIPRPRTAAWLIPLTALAASCSLNAKISHTKGSNAQVVSPNVSSVSPTAASTFGGATLTVSGSGFQPTTQVVLADGQACLNVHAQTSTTLQCVLPPHAAGNLNLVITTPGAGASATIPYSFRSDLFTQVDFVAGSYTVDLNYVEGTGKIARMTAVGQYVSDGTYVYAGMGDTSATFHVITRLHIGSGQLSTYAGDTLDQSGGTGDGPIANAQFRYITGLTRIGRVLYALDADSCSLRKIDMDAGVTSTLAGQASPDAVNPCDNLITDGDGPTVALFKNLGHMTNDGQNLYFHDGHTIRKYNIASHAVTTLVGDDTTNPAEMVDGLPPTARIYSATGLVFAAGKLFMSDGECIREINPLTGEINAFAGKCVAFPDNTARGTADGIGPSARFRGPSALTTDGTNLYVADTNNHTIRKISITTGQVTTIAGNATVGVPGTNEGPIGVALLSYPHYVIYDPGQGLLVSSGVDQTYLGVTAVRKIH